MSQADPIIILPMFCISCYIAWLYFTDYKAYNPEQPNPKAFPGATPCPPKAIFIAILGALFILSAETYGEYYLEINNEQSTLPWLFLLSMISAAFIEELIFRGFLVITSRGKFFFLTSIVGFSFIFALLHPFLWEWEDTFHLNLSIKALFSTSVVFLNSLWFYSVRFYKYNPNASLLPCFVAHLISNLGVFAIKYAQGFVKGLY